jgi:hypothetical protein
MMWRLSESARTCTVIGVAFSFFYSCNSGIPSQDKTNKFSAHPLGYYFQLVAFNSSASCYQSENIAQIDAVFKNQADSTFWDSHNNLNNHLFVKIDSCQKNNFFKYHISKSCPGDSFTLLIKTLDFFHQQFQYDSIPFFSKNDSVVKVHFKINNLYTSQAFQELCIDLQKQEIEEINDFFKLNSTIKTMADASGFYWIEYPGISTLPTVKNGDLVTIAYTATFLNGRFLEKSSDNFEFIYGTPDQVLKGLNYVIGKLKLGQNAKILLPSRLAFGEKGSSNGMIPPFTPLIYEIKIIDVKQLK